MRFPNHFVFIAQVRKRFGKCIRSSDRCLLLLSWPRLCDLAYDFALFLGRLLLLGGDVETNPGPELTQIMKQLKEISTDIKEIKEKRLVDIDNKLDALGALEEKLISCQDQIFSMTSTIQTLEQRIEELENRSRRSNLIVYGLEETKDETSEKLERAVNNDIIVSILELEPVQIERIHRLGRPAPNKIRPVIMKLFDSRQKAAILKNGFKLKDTDLSIGEDFSRKTREIRKKLWDSAKSNREKKDKVALAYTKLYINDIAYVWDDLKDERVPLQKNDDTVNRPKTRRNAQSKK